MQQPEVNNIDIDAPSKQQIISILHSLKPEPELHTGLIFLERLVKQNGIAAPNLKLLEYDFSPNEMKMLKQSRPDLKNRRTFLHTLG